MKTIGLIGGVASGKSLVAQMFVELGRRSARRRPRRPRSARSDPDVREALDRPLGPSDPGRRWQLRPLRPSPDASSAIAPARRRRTGIPRIGPPSPHRQPAWQSERPHFAAAGHARRRSRCPAAAGSRLAAALRSGRFRRRRPRAFASPAPLTRGWTAEEFARREAAQWPVERKAAPRRRRARQRRRLSTRCDQSVCDVWHKYVAS